ncbi:MAG: hypothetical protein OFPI_04840 [Osedax symbiont Rs2]|nr:MAG: hypothetical protein OFPI_04840 [Osedax symbiont Rs2]
MTKNNKASILIVDDNPVNIDLLRRYLEGEGYSISAVTSGEKALKVVTKIHIDLILLDIMMPGMDGYQTCTALKQSTESEHIPVIFVTAKIEPEDLRYGFAVGAADYITKPVQQDIILARVKNQLSIISQMKLKRELLEKSNKMAELGNMVAGIAHEVASPMGNLMLTLDYILQKTQKKKRANAEHKLDKQGFEQYLEKLTEAANMCHANAKRATDLMASFKQVAVNQCSNKNIEFNLGEYLEDILLTLRPKLKKYPHTVTVLVDREITITNNPGALSQVVINLVNNSLLHAFNQEHPGSIEITATQQNHQVTLVYSDDGLGMSSEQLKMAFNKYYTTKAGEGGSGLGLAITKELVEQEMQGSIELESSSGSGTKFTISFANLASA